MPHEPCGPNSGRPCCEYGTCNKYFPRRQVDVTDWTPDGYALYRRRLYYHESNPMPQKTKVHVHAKTKRKQFKVYTAPIK